MLRIWTLACSSYFTDPTTFLYIVVKMKPKPKESTPNLLTFLLTPSGYPYAPLCISFKEECTLLLVTIRGKTTSRHFVKTFLAIRSPMLEIPIVFDTSPALRNYNMYLLNQNNDNPHLLPLRSVKHFFSSQSFIVQRTVKKSKTIAWIVHCPSFVHLLQLVVYPVCWLLRFKRTTLVPLRLVHTLVLTITSFGVWRDGYGHFMHHIHLFFRYLYRTEHYFFSSFYQEIVKRSKCLHYELHLQWIHESSRWWNSSRCRR